jgi:hypothetical protein
MKDKERTNLSVIPLIDNGLHTNEVAYSAAKALLDLHGSLNSIRHVAQNHVDESNNIYDARIGCGLIVTWMEEALSKIEEVHDQKLNVNHYDHKG